MAFSLFRGEIRLSLAYVITDAAQEGHKTVQFGQKRTDRSKTQSAKLDQCGLMGANKFYAKNPIGSGYLPKN